MSKEYIEAFKNLKQELYYSPNQIPDIDKWHETIEQALERLEAIDNAEPSEALVCLLSIYSFSEDVIYQFEKEYNTVRQALLKAQEQEKFFDDKLVFKNGCIMSGFDYKGKQIVAMPLEEYNEFMKQEKAQEPKQYLKWEDLEFNHTPKMIDVKMSGNKYKLVVGYNVAGKNLAILRSDKQQYCFLEVDKQFFNDLHLERVEE